MKSFLASTGSSTQRQRDAKRTVRITAFLIGRGRETWQEGRVVVPNECDTIADGLASLRPLEANVIAIRELVDDVRLVSEQEMLGAIRILLLDEHILAEASGAAATAAFLQNPSAYADANIVLLVSGANISPEVLRRAIT